MYSLRHKHDPHTHTLNYSGAYTAAIMRITTTMTTTAVVAPEEALRIFIDNKYRRESRTRGGGEGYSMKRGHVDTRSHA